MDSVYFTVFSIVSFLLTDSKPLHRRLPGAADLVGIIYQNHTYNSGYGISTPGLKGTQENM